MIKDSGDFTKSLLALLYKAKCDFISQNKLDILSGKSFHKLSFDFLLKEDQIYNYVCDINDARKNTKLPIYPFVGLYGPVRAPAVGALEKENVIFVGLGVGVSPYLVFLDEYVNFLRKKKKVQTSKKNKSRLMKQFISNFR